MVWQNLRPALTRAARLAFLTCALAALALSAPSARRLGTEASAQGERFEGRWLVEYRTDEGKTSLALNYQEDRRGADGRVYPSTPTSSAASSRAAIRPPSMS